MASPRQSVPMNQRVYGVLRAASGGMMKLDLSLTEPQVDGATAVLIWRGTMPGLTASLPLVSDPKADPNLTGPPGPNGWTPVLAAEQDGTRTLFKVVGWQRSSGAPATGYLTPTGTLTAAKAEAFNFNAIKRVDIFSATSVSTGIASVVFDPPFTTAPVKVLPMATPNVLAGPVKAELVANSITKTGCQVKVTQHSLVGGVVSVLAGASVQVIAIEG